VDRGVKSFNDSGIHHVGRREGKGLIQHGADEGGDARFLAGARAGDVQPLDAVHRDKIQQHLAVRDGCRQGDGSTVAQAYERLGIRLKTASMDRLNGWADLMQCFGEPEPGVRPTLFIHQ